MEGRDEELEQSGADEFGGANLGATGEHGAETTGEPPAGGGLGGDEPEGEAGMPDRPVERERESGRFTREGERVDVDEELSSPNRPER